jgi:hypothetical protein
MKAVKNMAHLLSQLTFKLGRHPMCLMSPISANSSDCYNFYEKKTYTILY